MATPVGRAVSLGQSLGEDCVICELPITQAARCIVVVIKTTILFVPTTYRCEVHLPCAKDLRDLIDAKLKEAGNGR